MGTVITFIELEAPYLTLSKYVETFTNATIMKLEEESVTFILHYKKMF